MTETGAPVGASRLESVLALAPGDSIERGYLFAPLERRGTSFTLVFVTKVCSDGRLEMIALGGRTVAEGESGWDFVRRARFPRATLSAVLEEFIERCGVEGASYREIDLSADGIPGLSDLLGLPGSPEPSPGPVDPT